MLPMSSGGQQGGDCFQDLKNWWATAPIFNSFIIKISCFFYFLSLFFMPALLSLLNFPLFTIMNLELWRLFTTPLLHLSFLQLLFSLLSVIPTTNEIEKSQGTVFLVFDFVVKNVVNQTVYCVAMILLAYALNPQFAMLPSAGLWSLVMIFITQRSCKNPEQLTNFLCFPIQLKQKYYPLCILLFLSLLSPQIDLFVSCFVGYLEAYCFKGQFVNFTPQTLQSWESGSLFKCIANQPTFIKISQISQNPTQNPQQNTQNRPTGGTSFQPQAKMEAPGTTTNPFSGKAVIIGQSEEVETGQTTQIKNKNYTRFGAE